MFDNEKSRPQKFEASPPLHKLTMVTVEQQLQMESSAWDADGDCLLAFGRQGRFWPDKGQFLVEFAADANLEVVARGLRKWATLLENDARAIGRLSGSRATSLRSCADGSLEPFDAMRDVYQQLHE